VTGAVVGRYGAILAVPPVRSVLGAAVLGRIPMGGMSLGMLLYVSHVTGSFATGGFVTGVVLAGIAISIPVGGRLIDRVGLRLLPWLAIVQALALALVVVLGEAGAPTAALAAGAALVGLSTPPLSTTLRALWPDLLEGRGDLLSTAYGLDSAVAETVFLGGPALAGLLYGLLGPASPLIIWIVLVLGGTLWFTRLLAHLPAAPLLEVPADWRGAFGSRGIRLLAAVALPVGFALGCFEASVVRACQEADQDAVAGAILAIVAGASGVGGLLYGAISPGPARVLAAYLLALALLPLAFAPMLLASSPLAMAPLAFLAGLPIAPQFAGAVQLARRLAPPGTETEAVGWPLTAVFGGLSCGIAATGAAADAGGATAGFALAVAGATVATAIGALGSRVIAVELGRTVRPTAGTAPPFD
jgi:MFS family permease